MEGHLEHDGHRTWYRVVGNLDPDASRAPVVICHGGPGATHDYLAPVAELERSGRAITCSASRGVGCSRCCTPWSAHRAS
jgi:L-proline amide hydrolase